MAPWFSLARTLDGLSRARTCRSTNADADDAAATANADATANANTATANAAANANATAHGRPWAQRVRGVATSKG